MSTLNVGTVNAATVNYTGDSTSSTSANRSLEDMTNVSGTPGTNQSLIWNGSAWAPANASGGYGIMIGPKAPKKEIEETINKIKKNPREFIAQPLEILSTAPTITENDIEPRHLDLRPFILTGKTNYVTTGGLTRVALRKGSTIVNSSQGGGSKDTLIVD